MAPQFLQVFLMQAHIYRPLPCTPGSQFWLNINANTWAFILFYSDLFGLEWQPDINVCLFDLIPQVVLMCSQDWQPLLYSILETEEVVFLPNFVTFFFYSSVHQPQVIPDWVDVVGKGRWQTMGSGRESVPQGGFLSQAVMASASPWTALAVPPSLQWEQFLCLHGLSSVIVVTHRHKETD